jgi:hypothetical protein
MQSASNENMWTRDSTQCLYVASPYENDGGGKGRPLDVFALKRHPRDRDAGGPATEEAEREQQKEEVDAEGQAVAIASREPRSSMAADELPNGATNLSIKLGEA